MTKPFFNDSIDDLLGGPAPTQPTTRQLPQDEGFARIRATVPEFTESCPKCHGRGIFTSYTGPLGRCFGIGPICAGRINRPGLKFVEVDKSDF